MLAGLYLQRCFHLVQEEYVKLGQVEQEIKVLESGE
jgi:ribosome-associated protein YbcJ (S4-like RNA binding protein)